MSRVADPFALTLLTTDAAWAVAADRAGVERVGVDIERRGKHARQAHIADARISDHTLEDLARVASVVEHAAPFVRIDPPHAGTADQVEDALGAGARAIMLPWFHGVDDARSFLGMVDGRADAILLVETREALDAVESLVRLPGLREIMVGLNDLGQALGHGHPMALVAGPELERVAAAARTLDVPFGFGGVADPAPTRTPPVDPDLVLARNADLGARAAWVARTAMHGRGPAELADVVGRIRERVAAWRAAGPDARRAACRELVRQGRRLAAVEAPR